MTVRLRCWIRDCHPARREFQVDLRARELVINGVEEVADETGRVVDVCAGERYGQGRVRLTGLVPANADLCAGWVELCAADRVGDVEADDLVTNEVVAGGEVRWEVR